MDRYEKEKMLYGVYCLTALMLLAGFIACLLLNKPFDAVMLVMGYLSVVAILTVTR